MISFLKSTGAMVNSMIGSAVLILPIVFIQNGLLLSLGVVIITGICTCYSNLICLDHMADEEHDFKETICRHNRRTDQFPWFVLFVFLSCELFLYTYFNLIMKQWGGIFESVTRLHPYLPYLTLISLLVLTMSIKKLHFGLTLMALGIVSVFMALFFMFWMFATRPQTQLKEFPLVKGDSLADLITLLIGAFSLQNVFVEILREHKQPKQRIQIVWIAYGLGICIYSIFGIIGGYGILNRQPIHTNVKTIMGYFHTDAWQPFLLQLVYLIHLYSVWPEWSYMNSIRLHQILDIQPSEWKINLYLIISPIIAFTLYMFQVNLSTFINLNGGVCLFFAIFAIPIYNHVKCRYFHQKSIAADPTGQFQSYWNERDQKCDFQREHQTTFSKITDICILTIMVLYGTASLLITITKTITGKHAIQH